MAPVISSGCLVSTVLPPAVMLSVLSWFNFIIIFSKWKDGAGNE
jgi:hypothetical protein